MGDEVDLLMAELTLITEFPCVFTGCRTVKHSKKNWEVHQSSKHYQSECWLCDMCRTVLYWRDEFVEHVKQDHADSGYGDDKDYIDYRHIIANYQGNFYCGFCEDVICTDDDLGFDSIRFRNNHILRHFLDGCVREEWVDL